MNNCGVIASFTPSNDSTGTNPSLGPFTSTSINATSQTWYFSGTYPVSNDPVLNLGNQRPGLYQIILVARNGACTDTASCYYYITGTQPADRNNIKAYYGTPIDEHSTAMTACVGGGYLLGGYSYTTIFDGYPKGLLIKIKESGCVEWSKKLGAQYDGRVYKVVSLRNGDFIVTGYNDNTSYVLKLDAQGNTIWSKLYRLGGQHLNVQWVSESDDGGLALMGGTAAGLTVVRIDAAGNILWNKAFALNNTGYTWYYGSDILAQGQDIYITGGVYQDYQVGNTNISKWNGFVQKLNDADGSTRWNRTYTMNGAELYLGDIHPYGGNLLINSTGTTGIPNANNTFHIIDPDGNLLSSTTLSTPGLSYGLSSTKAMSLANGDLYFLNTGTETLDLQPYFAYHSLFVKLNANQDLRWAYVYGQAGHGRFFYPSIGQNGTFAAAGDEVGNLVETFNSFSDKLQFKKFDSTGGNSENYYCGFYPQNISITHVTAISQPFVWSSESILSADVTNTSFDLNNIYAQVRYECPEFVDSCTFLKLTGNLSICDLSAGYTLYNTPVNSDHRVS